MELALKLWKLHGEYLIVHRWKNPLTVFTIRAEAGVISVDQTGTTLQWIVNVKVTC